MFSQLGPLFKTAFRQAESTDARLEIRREEKQDQGKKKEHDGHEEPSSPLWEDSTTVSLEALQTFLAEFLKSKGDSLKEEERLAIASHQGQQNDLPISTPVTSVAARAMKAYASHTTPAAEHDATPPLQNENVDLVSLLRADELRTIHQLIRELSVLSSKGIQTLTIEKADTFLEALVRAVQTLKNTL